MNSRLHLIETNLKRTAARWRWLRLIQHTSTLGIFVCLAFLTIPLGVLAGWTPQSLFLTTLEVLLSFCALVVWFGVLIAVLSKPAQRGWLAGLLERGQPGLLDRLNTLVHLEPQARRSSSIRSFYLRIARQAQGVLGQKTPAIPLSPARAVLRLLMFIAVCGWTIWVYQEISPRERIEAARQTQAEVRNEPKPEPAPELALPTNNLVEQKQPWGEIRITEPGRDLQVTRSEVVPLQIEAASNESLKEVGWASALNGAEEQPHSLPAPSDPRYAVYQPALHLDEMQLSDWDVVTYYAQASAGASNAFASEVYFLEVRPFQEDLLKMPGGESGQAYEFLNELTSLISRQQQIIRQTHQHVQKPPEQPGQRAQDRRKLGEAEGDLSQSINHLHAKIASAMEGKPVGPALDPLGKAESDSGQASHSLGADAMPDAQKQERSALADLAAARKAFQKVITDNPNAFAEAEEKQQTQQNKPDSLKEIAEFRDEARAAQDLVEQSAQKQQQLTARTATAPRANFPQLADEEKKLAKSLEEFQNQHPRPFNGVRPETEQAAQALTEAAESLEKKTSNAKTNAQEAASELQKLSEAMKRQTQNQQLADAYKLKQMLDKQIDTFSQCEKAGDSLSDSALQKTIGQSRETLRQLKSAAEQQPTRDLFGPNLRESLSGPNITSLNWPLGELERAADKEAREKAAGKAKDALSKVSKAFSESQPKAMQESEKSDSLKPPGEQGLERGLAQLQNLLRQLEQNQPMPSDDQAKAGREALYNLQRGLRETAGSNERGNQIMVHVDEELKKGEFPLDLERLKKLLDQLQNFSLELSGSPSKEEKTEVTHIDPSQLPPAYRGRIEKYFQKLSEK